jgi:hypothetical protein
VKPHRRIIGLALALSACAAPPPVPLEPALVSLSVMRGFATPLPGPAPPRVVALVDATAPMATRDAQGSARFEAARAAALRWLGALPEATSLEMRAVGGARGDTCSSRPHALAEPGAARDAYRAALGRLAPAGQGALAEALLALASEHAGPAPTPLRVVAWSSLQGECGASLCDAARELAGRGVRLDLVVIGDATVPACLADLEGPSAGFAPPPAAAPVGFRVERVSPEPAVVACSESGGLPVAAPLGATRIVVALEPPLVLERSFPAATRWTLEVVDFPALDPPARQWRWRPLARPGYPGEAP